MPIVGNTSSEGKKPDTPTIGTPTGGDSQVSLAFTPSTYIGKDSVTYTATSTPGSISATGSSSPIVVAGLSNGTSYTFTVAANTNYVVASDTSSASSAVTPAAATPPPPPPPPPPPTPPPPPPPGPPTPPPPPPPPPPTPPPPPPPIPGKICTTFNSERYGCAAGSDCASAYSGGACFQ